MNLDKLNAEELLDKLKKLTGGGLGAARTYNDFDELTDRDEDEVKNGYQLRFIGKDYARLQASHKTETMLVPNVAQNQADRNEDSQNLFITGDNLDALKHLENSYSGQVDVIYIDPPYNTGSDGFVYNDSFNFSDEDLKLKLGMSDGEVERVRNLSGKSSHSAWLTFMYPRLRIAKRLLKDTGVIFISIDDNEQANLKVLCDEIFGDTNFVADFIVVRSEGGGLAKQAIIGHDYLLSYARNEKAFTPLGKPKDIRGKIVEKDGEEYWIETDWLRKEFGKYGTCLYDEIEKYHGDIKKKEIDEGLSSGIYTLVDVPNGQVVGRYRSVKDDTSKFYTVLKHLNKSGVQDLEELGIDNLFSFPKPVSLLKEVLLGATIKNKNALILDFFAGSGTTGDAVMQLNAEDGGSRKYILVQLDEAVASGSEAEKQGYKQIDEISRKRLELAADKIFKEKGDELGANFDAGFKHYSLATTDAATLDKLDSFDPSAILIDDMTTVFSGKDLGVDGDAGGEETLLATWLVDDGYGFTDKIQVLHFADATAYEVAGRLYILDKAWSKESTKELLNTLGNNKLRINSIVLYAYSFGLETLHELKVNIKTNIEDVIEIIERF